MKKAVLLSAVTLAAMTALTPVQAKEAKTPKSFEEKKEMRLEKAGKQLSAAKKRYNCIKDAQDITALNSCKKKKKPSKK